MKTVVLLTLLTAVVPVFAADGQEGAVGYGEIAKYGSYAGNMDKYRARPLDTLAHAEAGYKTRRQSIRPTLPAKKYSAGRTAEHRPTGTIVRDGGGTESRSVAIPGGRAMLTPTNQVPQNAVFIGIPYRSSPAPHNDR